MDLLGKSQSLGQSIPSSKSENFIEKIEYAKKNMENGAEIGEEIKEEIEGTYKNTNKQIAKDEGIFFYIYENYKDKEQVGSIGPYKDEKEFKKANPTAKSVNGKWIIGK